MTEPITILIADDHPLVLKGIADFVAAQAGFSVIALAKDGQGALEAIRTLRPDVALLDLSLPPPDGLDILREVGLSGLSTRIIFLTASISQAQILDALAAGVHAVLLKESAPEELLSSIREVARGRRLAPRVLFDGTPSRADAPGEADSAPQLTSRESEIAGLVAAGLSNKEIARRLDISDGTVKIHLHNIFGKLQVTSRTKLAARARGVSSE